MSGFTAILRKDKEKTLSKLVIRRQEKLIDMVNEEKK